jgi:hypothetical protein
LRFQGRWIIFLGWLLVLGAFTGAYSQKNINHKFPRVGTLQWGGGSPDWLRRFNLVITINPDSQRVRAARAMNPDAYYLATWDWNAGGPFYDFWDPSKVDTAWRVRNQAGVYVPYALQSLVDITDYCGLANGRKYNQALPERLNQEVAWSVFDGVNSDGTWAYPSGTTTMGIDLDRNKRNDYTEPGKGYAWIK